MSVTDYAAPLSEREQQMVNRLLSNPLLFPRVFRQWLVNYIGPEVLVTQSQVVNANTAVYTGTGTPESQTAAAVGSLFLRTDGGAGTTLYVKESGTGTTGWIARDSFTNGLSITDGKNVSIGSGTGTKLGATGAKLGFLGATPVARSSAYTPTNVTTDRAYDANATTTDELADVLGTLIADLQATGLIG